MPWQVERRDNSILGSVVRAFRRHQDVLEVKSVCVTRSSFAVSVEDLKPKKKEKGATSSWTLVVSTEESSPWQIDTDGGTRRSLRRLCKSMIRGEAGGLAAPQLCFEHGAVVGTTLIEKDSLLLTVVESQGILHVWRRPQKRAWLKLGVVDLSWSGEEKRLKTAVFSGRRLAYAEENEVRVRRLGWSRDLTKPRLGIDLETRVSNGSKLIAAGTGIWIISETSATLVNGRGHTHRSDLPKPMSVSTLKDDLLLVTKGLKVILVPADAVAPLRTLVEKTECADQDLLASVAFGDDQKLVFALLQAGGLLQIFQQNLQDEPQLFSRILIEKLPFEPHRLFMNNFTVLALDDRGMLAVATIHKKKQIEQKQETVIPEEPLQDAEPPETAPSSSAVRKKRLALNEALKVANDLAQKCTDVRWTNVRSTAPSPPDRRRARELAAALDLGRLLEPGTLPFMLFLCRDQPQDPCAGCLELLCHLHFALDPLGLAAFIRNLLVHKDAKNPDLRKPVQTAQWRLSHFPNEYIDLESTSFCDDTSLEQDDEDWCFDEDHARDLCDQTLSIFTAPYPPYPHQSPSIPPTEAYICDLGPNSHRLRPFAVRAVASIPALSTLTTSKQRTAALHALRAAGRADLVIHSLLSRGEHEAALTLIDDLVPDFHDAWAAALAYCWRNSHDADKLLITIIDRHPTGATWRDVHRALYQCLDDSPAVPINPTLVRLAFLAVCENDDQQNSFATAAANNITRGWNFFRRRATSAPTQPANIASPSSSL